MTCDCHNKVKWHKKICYSRQSASNCLKKTKPFRSIQQRTVPLAWKTAYITPIPKVSHVAGPGDFRPISVTSILARTVEKLIVKNYLTTYLTGSIFNDQYACKPTGSTTCALVDFTYRIHTLPETNQYVRCVLIDFSKAFDMVDHPIFARKLLALQVPLFLIQWIMSLLTNRMQATRVDFCLSSCLPINRSIVQGSGIGATLFICFAYDLKSRDTLNYLLKYADELHFCALRIQMFQLNRKCSMWWVGQPLIRW